MLNLIEAFRQYQAGRPGGMGLSGFFDFLKSNHDTIRNYIQMTYGEDE